MLIKTSDLYFYLLCGLSYCPSKGLLRNCEIFTKLHLKLYTVSHRIPGPGCVRWTNGLDKGFVGLQPRYLLSHQTELNFKPLRKLEFGPPSQQKEIIRCIHATTTTTPCPCPQHCIQRILLISSLNSHQDLLCKDGGSSAVEVERCLCNVSH